VAVLLEIVEEGAADVVGRGHGHDVNVMLRCGKARTTEGAPA